MSAAIIFFSIIYFIRADFLESREKIAYSKNIGMAGEDMSFDISFMIIALKEAIKYIPITLILAVIPLIIGSIIGTFNCSNKDI